MNTTWSRSTEYIVGVGLALVGIFILYLCRPILPMLVVGALIAAIIRPVIGWLHHSCRLHHGLAVGLAYMGLAAASSSLCSHCQGIKQRTEDHRLLLFGPLPRQQRWYGAQVALQRSPILRPGMGIVSPCQARSMDYGWR